MKLINAHPVIPYREYPERKKWKFEHIKQSVITFRDNLFPSETISHPFFAIHSSSVIIKDGYATDGITIAPELWLTESSFVHDALCQAIRLKLLDKKYQKLADQIFLESCLIVSKRELSEAKFQFIGIPTSYTYYYGVRAFSLFK